jgi:hypothetical protein
MKRGHAFGESCYGANDVFDCLSRKRLRQEADEVTRMPGVESRSDFAVRLEAADAWSVTGARIDDYERPLSVIDVCSGGRLDTDETIVDWPQQLPPVHDKITVELENMRHSFRRMLPVPLASLPQDVKEQYPPLCGVNHIGAGLRQHLHTRLRGKWT